MGWTKHPDAVKTMQGARSDALSSVRKLTRAARTNGLTEDERQALGRELHSELRRFVSLHHAVGGHDRPHLGGPVQAVLQLVHSFTFTEV